jgi:hypothetical protein
VLRLRGQGGVLQDGQPGDLYVALEVVDRAMRAEERVAGWAAPALEPARGSATLTWLLLLGLAFIAGTAVLLLFG